MSVGADEAAPVPSSRGGRCKNESVRRRLRLFDPTTTAFTQPQRAGVRAALDRVAGFAISCACCRKFAGNAVGDVPRDPFSYTCTLVSTSRWTKAWLQVDSAWSGMCIAFTDSDRCHRNRLTGRQLGEAAWKGCWASAGCLLTLSPRYWDSLPTACRRA